MTLNQAIEIIRNKHVPDFLYAINSLGSGECAGIAFDARKWITYYSERGARASIVEHKTESDACARFLEDVEKRYNYRFGSDIKLLLI